jgi:predicted ribosomally synthesized peptide with SipW-like signal peptide
VSRITRKELKTDKFALELGHTVDYVGEHKSQILRYAAVAIGLILIATGTYMYFRSRQTARLEELASAMRVHDATVGPATPAGGLNFPTEEAKIQASNKALSGVISNHPSSDEAMIARYLMAGELAKQEKLGEAEKLFQQVSTSGTEVAPLAQLALGEVYFATNRPAEGEKLLRGLIERPTMYVSKEQATVALARHLARTKPEEARKMLESAASADPNSPVARIAVGVMGELNNQ